MLDPAEPSNSTNWPSGPPSASPGCRPPCSGSSCGARLNNRRAGTIFSALERSPEHWHDPWSSSSHRRRPRPSTGSWAATSSVKASMGHVRDLPKRELGVDEEDFTPVLPGAPRQEEDAGRAAQGGQGRQRRSTSPPTPTARARRSAGTSARSCRRTPRPSSTACCSTRSPSAPCAQAFEQPREIDMHKVEAQQARRILDRLVGYKISPLLWDKVRRGLSAGRVQSVALRIICEREREILEFETREYWSLRASLAGGRAARRSAPSWSPGTARRSSSLPRTTSPRPWSSWAGRSPANGRSRTATRTRSRSISRRPAIRRSPSASARSRPSRRRRTRPRRSSPPSCSRTPPAQLGFSVSKTMRLAQGLYEGRAIGDAGTVGLITYMRTDSTRVSNEAIEAVREFIAQSYGAESLPEKPRAFRSPSRPRKRTRRSARPRWSTRRKWSRRYLGRDEFRLYSLIWNRFVASQMAVRDLRRDAGGHRGRPATSSAPTARCCASAAGSPSTSKVSDEDQPQEGRRRRRTTPRTAGFPT